MKLLASHLLEINYMEYVSQLGELCKNSYSTSWAAIYKAFGENDWAIYVVGSCLVPFPVFCLTNLFLSCVDVVGKPSALQKYKIQQDKNVPLKPRQFLQAMCLAGFNMSVVSVVHTASMWLLAKWRVKCGIHELPTLSMTVWHMLTFVAVYEVGFYYLHRIMHQSFFLYKHVHKYHHQWRAPCAMATFYCHPAEHYFVNLLPLTLGPIITGSHLSTAWLWYNLALLSTTLAHSGYHFPFLPSSEAHDFHHSRGTENYGSLGILDWFHGTDKKFKNSSVHKRHFVLWTLTPVQEVVGSTA